MTTRLTPLPLPRRSRTELLLAVKIESPSGWLDLENEIGGYEIHTDSFAESAQTFRRRMVENDWVEGSFTVSAVPENVTETLAVWVSGETQAEFVTRKEALVACFKQPSYRLMVRLDDVATYWDCQVADYTVSTSQPMLFAKTGLVKAQVPRGPSVEIVLASGDEL